jgi:hypothetical protein
MTILDRAGLLAALEPRSRDVTLPNGGTARVRTITAAERIGIATASLGNDEKVDTGKFSALLVAASVVDEAGARVFSDADADMLLGSPSDVFEALFGAAQAINGMGAKAAESAAGN